MSEPKVTSRPPSFFDGPPSKHDGSQVKNDNSYTGICQGTGSDEGHESELLVRLSNAQLSLIFDKARPALERRARRALGLGAWISVVVERAIRRSLAEFEALGCFQPSEALRRVEWWLEAAVANAAVLLDAFTRHQRGLIAHAAKLVGGQEATDLVQESIVRSLSKRDWLEFDDDRAAIRYLRVVIKNVARERQRSHRRLRLAATDVEHDDLVEATTSEEATGEDWQRALDVEEAFARAAPLDQQRIIEYQEARETAVPATDQERQHVFRSRERVRRQFIELGIEPPTPANDNRQGHRRRHRR